RKSLVSMMSASDVLYNSYGALGKYKQAYEWAKIYMEHKDSTTAKQKLRETSRLEAQYEYEKTAELDSIASAQEVAALEAEADAQATRTTYLIILLIVVALAGAFGYNRFLATRKQKNLIESQKDQLAKQSQEREILLKEIHHRVKNNLQVISSLLEIQSFEIDDEKALVAVEDGQNRVKAMALIHEKLYQNENLAQLNFDDYTAQLVKQIASIFPGGQDVTVQINGENIDLDIDTAIPLGLIMSELLTNAFKYARENNPDPRIWINLEQGQEAGSMILDVRDNGPGLPADFELEKAKSLGLRLVRNLARQLYGTVTYRDEVGAVFKIEFKDLETRKSVD
ncbi:MAG: sensor histidine kinase, partial [Bacteroidota bacterium]